METIEEGHKTCKKCDITKAHSEFGNRIYQDKTTINATCKKCNAAAAKKNRDEHPEKVLETNRRYLAKNQEKAREWNRNHFLNNGDRVRERARNNYRRYKENAHITIKINCSNRIRKMLQITNIAKTQSTNELIGCSIKF